MVGLKKQKGFLLDSSCKKTPINANFLTSLLPHFLTSSIKTVPSKHQDSLNYRVCNYEWYKILEFDLVNHFAELC